MNRKLNTIFVGAGAVLSSALLFPTQEAAAQTAADAILEEVVVTARRREESLADLPLSVVAITGDAMQAQGMYNTQDIGEFAANLTMAQTERMGHARVHIRGIGGGNPNPIQAFGAGMYIDGHYLTGSLGNYMSTFDVERVEVLRGPQGTLFGKNTTGGAVNIVTTPPQPEFESSLTARMGDFGQQDIRGMINVPISENVLGRFSIASEESDGYYTNRFLNSNEDFTGLKAIRAALRFTPGDSWTIDTTVAMFEERNGQTGSQCRVRPTQAQVDRVNGYAWNPGGATAGGYVGFDDGVGQWGGGNGHVERLYNGATLDFWNACDTDNAMGDFVTSGNHYSWMNNDTQSFVVAANWDAPGAVGSVENMNVKINASYRNGEMPWNLDRDKTPLSIDRLGATSMNPSDHAAGYNVTRGLEFIVSGDISDRLNFVAGVNLFNEEHHSGNGNCFAKWTANWDPVSNPEVPCELNGLLFEFIPHQPGQPDTGGPSGAFQNTNVWNEASAVFGHLTYALSDLWTLELGARYTQDDRSFEILETDAGATCVDISPAMCSPTLIMSEATVIEDGFFNSAVASFSETTPMISLSRTLGDGDSMVYFLMSEGFLTGSFNDELNLFRQPALAPLTFYGPEHVTNYEVGFKGSLADGRVRLNVDFFIMDYTDKQESIDLDNFDGRFGGDPDIGIIANAGQVTITGVELELRASPWDGGFFTLDAGLLDNVYDEFLSADLENPGSGDTVDLSQRNIQDRTPDWTLNASVGHTFQLASGGSLTGVLGLYSQGGYEWLGSDRNVNDGPSFCYQPSYNKLRARLTYEPAEGNWEASLFGSNIADERYLLQCADSRSGVYDYTYGRPDAWGLEFVARWGEN